VSRSARAWTEKLFARSTCTQQGGGGGSCGAYPPSAGVKGSGEQTSGGSTALTRPQNVCVLSAAADAAIYRGGVAPRAAPVSVLLLLLLLSAI
jgi:hypothetical protein